MDIFTKRIQDTGGCPGCINNILDEFADNFFDEYEDEMMDDDCCKNQYECECDNDEFSDEQIEEIRIIEDFAYKVMNINCGADLRNTLYKLYSIGKNVGRNNYRCFMRELIDESLND